MATSHPTTRPGRSRKLGFGVMCCIALAWTGISVGSAKAACVGPSLSIQRSSASTQVATVRAGATETIVGSDWFTTCNDTPGPCEQGGVAGPRTGIEVGIVRARPTGTAGVWKPGGNSVPLRTVDADAAFGFRIPGVTMPGTPGRYLLVVGSGPTLQTYEQLKVTS